MKWSSLMPAALLLLLCIACNDSKRNSAATFQKIKLEDIPGVADSSSEEEEYQEKPQGDRQGGVTSDKVATGSDDNWEKKIIKTATLNMETKDYNKYYAVVHESVKRVGGYIAQEDQTRTEYKHENTVAVKVPVAQFDEALELLADGTGNDKLIEKKIASEDVTGQVVDTKSRLEAKRQVRIRYLELLKQARNMGEVLQVQNEINELQEQIEMAAGRIAFLNQSSAYSTINLTFFQVLNPAASDRIEPSFLTRVVRAFDNGWSFIKLLLLALISVWPLLLGVTGIWFLVKKWRSVKAKVV